MIPAITAFAVASGCDSSGDTYGAGGASVSGPATWPAGIIAPGRSGSALGGRSGRSAT